MQGLCGGAVLWIVGLFSGEVQQLQVQAITLRSWLALGYLIFFGSMIGFTSYLYILKNSTAARVGTYAFLNPVVALFLGWLILGEQITLRTVVASVIILTAVILVISAPHQQKLVRSRALAAPEQA
jgi:drug/metabolite transporter (DMT)-like permease